MRRHKKQRTNELPRHTVGYVRVSTEEQGICGLGIQAQSAGITRKAEELGLQLVKIYEEVASGTSTDRPQMVAALDHAAGSTQPDVSSRGKCHVYPENLK